MSLSFGLASSLAIHTFNGDVTGTLSTELGMTQTTSAAGSQIFLGLHTADPGNFGTTAEVTTSNYGGYARLPVNRYKTFTAPPAAEWTLAITGNALVTLTNARSLNFPVCDTSGGGGSGAVLTHWSAWSAVSGANSFIGRGVLKASGASFKVASYADPSAGIFHCVGHGLVDTDRVIVVKLHKDQFSSIPIGGADALVEGTAYFAVAASADPDEFSLSLTSGGAALVPTSAGVFVFIKANPVTVTAGGIPSFSPGSLAMRIA